MTCEWVKYGKAALMDGDKGVFRVVAMANGSTTVAPLLTHNTSALLLDHNRLMIVNNQQHDGRGYGCIRYSGYNW